MLVLMISGGVIWLFAPDANARSQNATGSSQANALYIRASDTGGFPIRLEGVPGGDFASIGVATDSTHVYVVRGGKLYQLQKDTLQVIKIVSLP
jgi:hypothetical protein